jgi:putative FmdB family regulatory protein
VSEKEYTGRLKPYDIILRVVERRLRDMPIYEYECDNCGKQCEVIQKFSDEPLRICPECGGQMHKLISQTSFILKGNGWYVTDYASPERKKALESHGVPPVENKEKTEVKPADKSETKTQSPIESTAKS